MGNELEKTITNQLPATREINQQAEKLYNINNVEHMTVVASPPVPTLDKGIVTPTDGLICDYYNLVVDSSVVDSVFVKVDKKRAIKGIYTEDELRDKYASLSLDAIKEIQRFPILVVPEATEYYGRASDDQYGYVGIIEKIRKDSCDIVLKCKFEDKKPIPLKKISEFAFELGIQNMDRAVTELNHTHWAIKPVNLIEELTEAKIDFKDDIF
ncbi:hypothetical protein [uncultured Megasphaera sp.]|jgi:hypothetical protein|uniref:hypothetical protein n=1 Tax=uncultured Megasphaera sp. TaxID=165188 RepID=UPI002596258F|nr:hypothetical protein [uncultured Megasphaera sp.]